MLKNKEKKQIKKVYIKHDSILFKCGKVAWFAKSLMIFTNIKIRFSCIIYLLVLFVFATVIILT